MTAHPAPPPGWPHRARRGLGFPPGRDGEQFEAIADCWVGPLLRFQLNLETLEVFRSGVDGWDQPPWSDLPPRVRARVWEAHRGDNA